MTHEERLAYQRERRRKNGNADTRKYEKTPNGFLMRLYRNMKSRVSGIQKAKFHLYRGCEILPREKFYAWANGSLRFWRLWKTWSESNYDRKLTPSVDRINSMRGYTIENMEWVTHSENSRRGAISIRRKVKI